VTWYLFKHRDAFTFTLALQCKISLHCGVWFFTHSEDKELNIFVGSFVSVRGVLNYMYLPVVL
jgi:hypothetical protein